MQLGKLDSPYPVDYIYSTFKYPCLVIEQLEKFSKLKKNAINVQSDISKLIIKLQIQVNSRLTNNVHLDMYIFVDYPDSMPQTYIIKPQNIITHMNMRQPIPIVMSDGQINNAQLISDWVGNKKNLTCYHSFLMLQLSSWVKMEKYLFKTQIYQNDNNEIELNNNQASIENNLTALHATNKRNNYDKINNEIFSATSTCKKLFEKPSLHNADNFIEPYFISQYRDHHRYVPTTNINGDFNLLQSTKNNSYNYCENSGQYKQYNSSIATNHTQDLIYSTNNSGVTPSEYQNKHYFWCRNQIESYPQNFASISNNDSSSIAHTNTNQPMPIHNSFYYDNTTLNYNNSLYPMLPMNHYQYESSCVEHIAPITNYTKDLFGVVRCMDNHIENKKSNQYLSNFTHKNDHINKVNQVVNNNLNNPNPSPIKPLYSRIDELASVDDANNKILEKLDKLNIHANSNFVNQQNEFNNKLEYGKEKKVKCIESEINEGVLIDCIDPYNCQINEYNENNNSQCKLTEENILDNEENSLCIFYKKEIKSIYEKCVMEQMNRFKILNDDMNKLQRGMSILHNIDKTCDDEQKLLVDIHSAMSNEIEHLDQLIQKCNQFLNSLDLIEIVTFQNNNDLQIVTDIAKDMAMNDYYYNLMNAFQLNKITLSIFLACIRKYSREHFLIKYSIHENIKNYRNIENNTKPNTLD